MEIFCFLINRIRIKLLKNKIPLLIVCSELPEMTEKDKIYITHEDGEWCYLLMKCPCGCGTDIDLSLIKNLKPQWKVQFHLNGTISLSPSIWRKQKCKSHFFYKKGKVMWCEK